MSLEILSERYYQNWPSYAVVYEWEDVFANILNSDIISLYRTKKIGRKIRHIMVNYFGKEGSFLPSNNGRWKLVWIMNAAGYRMFTGKGILPVFLDFSTEMVENIVRVTKKLPCYWVTSYDIYELLKKHDSQNVEFMPLSISDKYINEKIQEKNIDVIQFGRKNKVLHEYMLNYCRNNPNVEYVYQSKEASLTYISTIRGNIGKFEKREEYMKLLAHSKVSLVSTPGMDQGRSFGCNDFFTPRFFESAAVHSHLIGRYADNQEARIIGISDICPNICSESQFNSEVTKALMTSCEVNLERYKKFLSENVTSVRGKSIKKSLQKYNIL